MKTVLITLNVSVLALVLGMTLGEGEAQAVPSSTALTVGGQIVLAAKTPLSSHLHRAPVCA